jgi:phage-related protein
MGISDPLRVVFYRSEAGNEPVREWLRGLSREDRKTIGEDIKTVQFSWPLRMPLVRKLEAELWEIRSTLRERVARVIFTQYGKRIVLLHGFIKKSQKTPLKELELAKKRNHTLRGKP